MEVRCTEGPGHAKALAREAIAEGCDTVVAAGGDGTVNEVLTGLAGSQVRLGVLPLGTMNVFAREHGVPLDWEDALARILRENIKCVDLGMANDRPFVQLAGVGLDARVIQGVRRESKRIWGAGAYVASAVRELGREQPVFSVHIEGVGVRTARWMLVGMGRHYGGAFPVFARAAHADGLLDVVLVRELGVGFSLACLAGVAWGGHLKLRGVEYFQTRHVRVETEQAWEVDGEFGGVGAVEFGIRPGALRVLV
jgi:YegS/Rv2252/BmrU family lipid kinase